MMRLVTPEFLASLSQCPSQGVAYDIATPVPPVSIALRLFVHALVSQRMCTLARSRAVLTPPRYLAVAEQSCRCMSGHFWSSSDRDPARSTAPSAVCTHRMPCYCPGWTLSNVQPFAIRDASCWELQHLKIGQIRHWCCVRLKGRRRRKQVWSGEINGACTTACAGSFHLNIQSTPAILIQMSTDLHSI